MTKYLLNRLLRGLLSIIIMVSIIMVMIYSMLDRNLIFAADSTYRNLGNNQQTVYKYRKWKEYGYIDYVTYSDYLLQLTKNGELDEETRTQVVNFGKKEDDDKGETLEYVQKFREYYESQGYTVVRLKAIMASPKKYATGGQQQYFAYKDLPLTNRLWKYLTGLISVDNIHKVQEDIGERGLTFTLHDPVYGGEKFAPAIIGNGTLHKYLLYTNDEFPFIHQNLVSINLGKSYTVNQGVDVFVTMNQTQGSYVQEEMTFPTGLTEMSADDLHSATYVAGSRETNIVYHRDFGHDEVLRSLVRIYNQTAEGK